MNQLVQPASSEAIRKASKATVVLQVFAAVLLVGLVAIFIVIANRYSTLQDGIRENALWSIYQLDREARKLHEAVHMAIVEKDASADALKLISNRYDILYSRMNILEEGTFDRRFGGDEDAGPAIDAIRTTIKEFEGVFDTYLQTKAMGADDLAKLDIALEPLLSNTENLLVYANNSVSSDRADARADLLSLQIKSAGLVALLVACLGFLIVSLRRQLSSVRAAGLSLEAMAGDLQRSYLAAEAGNRSKSQFMATMGHEIRTPLNAILGTTELLELSKPSPSVTHGLATIRKSGQALLEIINEILDYAKLDHGKLTVELCPTIVEETVGSVMEMLEDRASENGNILRAVYPEQAAFPVVECDPTRLRQVLLNLTSNAIKFTKNGVVTVKISEQDVKGEMRLRFDVTDTGIGIDEEGVAKLFQPFSQVDATISRKYGGTGLGLTICKEIVERLGGSIGVTSSKGVGSTFWFELPVKAAKAPSVVAQISAVSDVPRGRRVLLVEDNKVNQEVAIGFLRHLGQIVVVANDGVEAVKIASEEDFDLILMDMQMPNMDGVEAARQIRKFTGKRGRVPIVAMTANASEDDRHLCNAVGMNGFQSKPVSLGKLREALGEWTTDRERHATPSYQQTALGNEFEERRKEMVEALGDDGFAELVASFFDDAEGLMLQLQGCVGGDDDALQDRLLHTLKGVASSIGLQALADSCHRLRHRPLTPESVCGLGKDIEAFKCLLAA